jgi:hypothetical protein
MVPLKPSAAQAAVFELWIERLEGECSSGNRVDLAEQGSDVVADVDLVGAGGA